MRRLDLAILLTFLVSPAFSEPNPGHHLPTGIEQVVRERHGDSIVHPVAGRTR